MTSRDDQSESFLDSDAIGDEFFISIVESKLNIKRDKFKLRLVLLSPATGKNENFVAVLYRAKIKIEIIESKERQSVDVIVKALLTTLQEFKEFSVFPRERFVYENVLSSFENIWLDKAGEKIQFGPKSIKFETDPYEIIVLDDLKAENYQMLDRRVGLNMVESKMLLAKLAKFHAASAIRYQQDGLINKAYFDRKGSMPPLPEDSPFVLGFMNMVDCFVKAVGGYGDCNIYAEKMSKWNKQKLQTQWVDVAEPMRSGFQVLNHGDIWLNNMMFKFDGDNNPIDLRIIDYQAPFWASPSSDIMYFLLSSVADDIKIDHFDEFIKYYHGQLTLALNQLNFDQPIPTLAELHVDILDKGAFACSCLMFILFVVRNDSNEEISIENMMTGGDNTEMMHKIYNNENYKKAIKLWLPFLDQRGFLDILIIDEVKAEEEKKEE